MAHSLSWSGVSACHRLRLLSLAVTGVLCHHPLAGWLAGCSHTKGGTVDRAVLEALAPGRAAAAMLSARKVTPLYTSATHTNNMKGQLGDGNKFYGSYLLQLKRR